MGWIISFHLFKSKKKYKKCENSPESNKNPKKMSTSSNSFLITVIAFFVMINVVVTLPLIGIRDDLSTEFVGIGLRDDVALPIQKRRVSQESQFCATHRESYDTYCNNFWTDRPQRLQTALFTFCPGYENKCLH
ncbi:uncharacterized protein CELE_F01F1.14 [Caenorhabditis elegans]|uniref:Uncharacterized protein n=1 Tax=Caenorhabditis elegans TaxID=6239 RepID=Q19095_CAEEL|nr:Uncharacterized protein CELE_F01F1.14 [Caenorhabditis elegans]CCD65999.1 Uncharacterized protein CELE_F01F1.14 [Caenorhabditis elegans]|eukprot:NP_498276.1 Uncharacterized protein CELE_F01F1.14 [Caenorhabditis elegans]